MKPFCLVINQYEDREGSEHDVRRIQQTMANMDVDCHVKEICTNSDIEETFEGIYTEFDQNLRDATFVIVFYMAHGQADGRDAEFKFVKRYLLMPLIQMRELSGRLKWIVLQRCSGLKKIKPAAADGEDYPKYYLLSRPVPSGAQAVRSGDENEPITAGYITAICEQLENHRRERPLKAMLQHIAQDKTFRDHEPYFSHNFQNFDFYFEDNTFRRIQQQDE